MIANKERCKIDNFVTDLEKEAKGEARVKLKKTSHNEFKGVFWGISCFVMYGSVAGNCDLFPL